MFPIRGAMMIFAVALSVIVGTIVCNLLAYLGDEEEKGSKVAKQWLTFKGMFRRNKGR